jgi:hypothetical protein
VITAIMATRASGHPDRHRDTTFLTAPAERGQTRTQN